MSVTGRELDGKVAIVTGAGRGIGKAIAIACAGAGAAVCCAARTVGDIEATVQTITTDSERVKTPEEVTPLALFLATQPLIGPTAQRFSLMRRDT